VKSGELFLNPIMTSLQKPEIILTLLEVPIEETSLTSVDSAFCRPSGTQHDKPKGTLGCDPPNICTDDEDAIERDCWLCLEKTYLHDSKSFFVPTVQFCS
jgi:hypothetical protein